MDKNKWQGEFVSDALKLSITKPESQIVPLEDLVGVALRKNPKRAHLLVSKVLGKHYPQSPALIKASAKLLAAQINGELLTFKKFQNPYSKTFESKLKKVLEGRYDACELNHELSNSITATHDKVIVFGFAETATALGAGIADALRAGYYINSTRYPNPEIPKYGNFEEEHSHASAHHLTPSNPSALNDPKKIMVLVDDELTTGKTILNTITMLEQTGKHSVYYIATLVDLRSDEDRERMENFAKANSIQIKVFSLFQGHLNIPSDSVEQAVPFIEQIKNTPEFIPTLNEAKVICQKYPVFAPNTKNGLDSFHDFNAVAHCLADRVKEEIQGNSLVLGIEEDMYLPLQMAEILEDKFKLDVKYSTTTRSPVIAYNDNRYPIKDRLKYFVPEIEGDTNERFAYNVGADFQTIIIVTSGPEQTADLLAPNSLIEQLKARTGKIIIMETSPTLRVFQEPLYAPEFGSYKRSDVEWLLKDLSSVKLEAPTEDREEAIQSGGAHYAESLPIEYQPDKEYTQLFLDSLQESKAEIALSIGVVAEQIFEQRNNRPVIVSLARAGTPIGVLIKRYIKKLYNFDAPHYAVSIIRGKGIDYNALNYIASKHNPADVIFVDGWTGKGAIVGELSSALEEYKAATGISFNSEVAVLADPGNCVTIFGTRDDFLIPSACLNSTVSGLVSRTVLNDSLIKENDYHGAKFYKEFEEADLSNLFVDTVSRLFNSSLQKKALKVLETKVAAEPDWSGWKTVEELSEKYGINNVNLVKPGVGETTRVLLRRVPWKILIRADKYDSLLHLRLLAKSRGVPIEVVDELSYAAIGLIHPKYTKGATGFDGGKVE